MQIVNRDFVEMVYMSVALFDLLTVVYSLLLTWIMAISLRDYNIDILELI